MAGWKSWEEVRAPHENEKPAFSNSSGLKSVFEKLRFHDDFVDGRQNNFLQRSMAGPECINSHNANSICFGN